MQEFISIILIGIGLSMDTFSVSLSIGIMNIHEKLINKISLIVGIFHFIMPLFGLSIGQRIFDYFNISSHYLLSIILMLLAIKLLKDYFSEETINMNLNTIGISIFAFTVSIDSLSTGIALSTITQEIIMATTIFAVLSFGFTYIGLKIGKYASYKIGGYSKLIGVIILLTVALYHLF